MSMSTEYESEIDKGLAAMLSWIDQKQITKLPASCWELPRDCPLWSLGLSTAQAEVILSEVRTLAASKGR